MKIIKFHVGPSSFCNALLRLKSVHLTEYKKYIPCALNRVNFRRLRISIDDGLRRFVKTSFSWNSFKENNVSCAFIYWPKSRSSIISFILNLPYTVNIILILQGRTISTKISLNEWLWIYYSNCVGCGTQED